MIKLDITQVLYLHDTMCKATGGSSELRDVGALESALYHVYASFEGKDFYPTIEEKAAKYLLTMILLDNILKKISNDQILSLRAPKGVLLAFT